MSRRESRILAVQGLYSWEVGNIPLEEVLKFEWKKSDSKEFDENTSDENSEEDKTSDSETFARFLISGTIENISEIDEIIKKHLKSWTLERVNKVSLSILRMSVYSLKYQCDIQPSVVIDEAIHIARAYGPEDSFKFINAILDNIKKYISKQKVEENK